MVDCPLRSTSASETILHVWTSRVRHNPFHGPYLEQEICAYVDSRAMESTLKSTGSLVTDIHRVMESLPAFERDLLKQYFGVDCDALSLRQIAEERGILSVEVQKHLTNSIVQLRARYGSMLFRYSERARRHRHQIRLWRRQKRLLARQVRRRSEPSCSPHDTLDDRLYEPLTPRILPIYNWNAVTSSWSIADSAFGWSNWRQLLFDRSSLSELPAPGREPSRQLLVIHLQE